GLAAAGRGADDGGVLDSARQIKVVGGFEADRDAHAGTVDIGNHLERRVLAHHVGALDDDVGRGEIDDGRAHRFDRDEADVPFTLAGGIEYLAGGVIGNEFDRYAEPLAQFAREIGRDALGLAGGFVLLRENRIAEVDRRPQL